MKSLYEFSSFAMTGIIWIVQLVHYPTFLKVSQDKFVDFINFHSAKITIIVFPLMSLELILSGYFSYTLQTSFWYSQLVITLLLWFSTMFISVPIHNKLTEFNEITILKLISTNWIRTILWSIKAFLLLTKGS